MLLFFCSILLPSCPTSASGCAATRGCTGCWPAWTCRSCRRRPSWSPEELASWWGNQKLAAVIIIISIYDLLAAMWNRTHIMQDVVAFSAFTRTDMVFIMLIKAHHIFKSLIVVPHNYAIICALYTLCVSTNAPVCSGCWRVPGPRRPQHSEGDEGGQLQTSAQDADIWSGSADVRGAADSLIFSHLWLCANLSPKTLSCRIEKETAYLSWKRRSHVVHPCTHKYSLEYK